MARDELIKNIDKIHTTEMGMERIKRNLSIDEDGVSFCKKMILSDNSLIYRNGKNYYIEIENMIITVNSYSFTIITAHRK